MQLLNQNIVESIILIELDPLVASFWRVVFYDTEWLINKIKETEVTLKKWQEIKSNLSSYKNDRNRAFACLFLNRTNFSGYMARNVGPIGGRSQKSKYKIDCRFPVDTLIDRIKQISNLSDRVAYIWNCSWEDGMAKIEGLKKDNKISKDLLYYLDPPFYKQADKLYAFYFKKDEHEDLRDEVLKMNEYWILSYDNTEEIKELYNGKNSNSTNIEVLYNGSSLKGGKAAKELIISNLKKMPKKRG